MPTMRRLEAMLLIVIGLVPILAGCRASRQTIRIEVPAGFSGPVHVTCGGVGTELQATAVDSNGRGAVPVCARDSPDVVVVRDGKTVDVTRDVRWARTGDGLPVSLDFMVHQ